MNWERHHAKRVTEMNAERVIELNKIIKSDVVRPELKARAVTELNMLRFDGAIKTLAS